MPKFREQYDKLALQAREQWRRTGRSKSASRRLQPGQEPRGGGAVRMTDVLHDTLLPGSTEFDPSAAAPSPLPRHEDRTRACPYPRDHHQSDQMPRRL